MVELATAIEHLDWAARNAKRVLGPRRVRPGLLVANLAATLEYQPFGVVGVIGPWNYPVFTPMGSIAYALAAGNAVVFKPREYTPAVGRWLVDSFAEVVPEQPVLQLVTGAGRPARRCAGPAWTRSRSPARPRPRKKIMAACAETLTPVLLECGGKDAMIVDADADLDAAADAARLGRDGQRRPDLHRHRAGLRGRRRSTTSSSAELAEQARRAAARRRDVIGPITMPAQIDVIRRHIDDALARGGRAVRRRRRARCGRRTSHPTVLVDVPEDAAAVTEETFGPTLTVTRVADADEAVELANALRVRPGRARCSPRHRRRADRPAAALRHGRVNSVLVVRRHAARCRSAGSATPASAASTATTGCASSPGPRRSPGSGSRPRSTSPGSTGGLGRSGGSAWSCVACTAGARRRGSRNSPETQRVPIGPPLVTHTQPDKLRQVEVR